MMLADTVDNMRNSNPQGQVQKRRPKPFQTKQYKGKGSKAENTKILKQKYEGMKGGVWEADEEQDLQKFLESGVTDLDTLSKHFTRSVRVVRRKLKKIAVAAAEDSATVDEASALTGLDVAAVRKMLLNKQKREKKKADKAKNKTLPPRDEVVELLKLLCSEVSIIRDQLSRVLPARPLSDSPAKDTVPALPPAEADETVCAAV